MGCAAVLTPSLREVFRGSLECHLCAHENVKGGVGGRIMETSVARRILDGLLVLGYWLRDTVEQKKRLLLLLLLLLYLLLASGESVEQHKPTG